MKRILRLTALSLCILPMAHAGDNSDKTAGSWWKGLSDSEKVWFIEGYAHGYAAGSLDMQYQLGHFKTDVSLDDKPVGITFGALEEGVDKCYSDFRNNNLDVEICLDWTVRSIHGTSDAEGEKFLEGMRKWA